MKLVFTSGREPIEGVGRRKNFIHDQTSAHIGHWEMIDYVGLEGMKELIPLYGNSIPGYTYK